MRFRLATTGAADPGVASIGNAFRTMAMMPLYTQQAAEEGRRAELQAQVAQSSIAKNLAEAAIKQEEQRQLMGRDGILYQMGAARAGMSVPEFQAGLNERQYGAPQVGPPVLPAPVAGLGPSGRTAAFDDALLTLFGPAMATPADKVNWEQLAKARGEYQDQGVLDQAVAAATGGNDMLMSRLNSVRGKKEFTPYAAVGTTGTALNQVTGAQDVSNQGLRAIFGDKAAAEIEADKARAGASRASAASSYASAAKTRADMDRDVRSGDLSVVTGPDGTVNIVNKRERTAQQVTGPNGLPLVKGSAGGANKTMTEGQAKANLFGTRMTEANKIFDELAAQGITRVNQLKRGADSLPVVGPMLGMAANATVVSPGQQRLEQAQRDFINAVLRRESGAVIADSEFANAAQQYFPQPGDSPAVVQQKRLNRERAAQLLLMEVPASVREQSAAIVPQSAPAAPAAPGAPRNVVVDY